MLLVVPFLFLVEVVVVVLEATPVKRDVSADGLRKCHVAPSALLLVTLEILSIITGHTPGTVRLL